MNIWTNDEKTKDKRQKMQDKTYFLVKNPQ